MKLHACLINITVDKLVSVIDEEHFIELSKLYSSVIDISESNLAIDVGWRLVGTDFQPPEDSNVALVPLSVTPRQMRTALVLSGISIDSINSVLDDLPEPNRSIAKIAWEFSTAFERNFGLINSMAPLLGLTQEQIDNLFILAKTL